MKHEIPYDKVSFIYDKILDHIDYEDWAYYIQELLELSKYKAESLLDLACGTGSFLEANRDYFKQLEGLEISKGMVEIAQAKLGSDIEIHQGDIRDFNLDKSFDLVTCLLDSVNYLSSLEDLAKTLDCVYKHLEPSGLFIFDAVSQKACKEHFFNYTEKNQVDDVEYERYCHYDMNKNIQYSEFTMTIDGENYYEKHIQHIFDFNDISKIIESSKFELINSFADFELKGIEKYTERAHFILRKTD